MTLLLATAGDRTAQGFSLLQQAAMVAGVYSLTRIIAGPWAAALWAVGCATVPPAVYFSGCGYVEPPLLMTLAASLLMLTFYFHSGDRRSGGGDCRVGGERFPRIAGRLDGSAQIYRVDLPGIGRFHSPCGTRERHQH